EARDHAELAAKVAAAGDRRSRATAHELLAKIALVRRDVDGAREEADLARREDPTLPMPAYIEGRLLYDQGRYADALPLFQSAVGELAKSAGLQLTDLHYYTGDTLGRLERY